MTEWPKRLTLLAMRIARGLILLDAAIVNIALPSIQRESHESRTSAPALALVAAGLVLPAAFAGFAYAARTGVYFCLTLLYQDVDGWSPTPWPVAMPSAAESTEVVAAVRALAAEHRSVILETFYRRRNVPQAADVLGVSADIVKARCYDALRELKLALAERGVST